jgi:hypothetical protein
MEPRTYPFQDPAVREKASQKARISPRPKTYYSKSKRVQEAKQELIKQSLLKDGFIQQVGAALPKINDALIKSASDPKRGASDRKTAYTILGLLKKDADEQPQTMGQLLADLYEQSEKGKANSTTPKRSIEEFYSN